jgi:hypothetical protein
MIRALLTAAIAAACLVGGAQAAPVPWKTVTITRQAGPISAVLTVQRQKQQYGGYISRNAELVVKNGGKTVFSKPICAPERCGQAATQALKLENVYGGSLDEAVVSIFTGGAHCCFEDLIILVDGPHAGKLVARNWGDPAFYGQRHDGTFEFVSADDRFAYEFTSYAGSGMPVQVWSLDPAGHFVDVTKSRLDLVRSDAKVWYHYYTRDRGTADSDVRGVFAAWCADEYTLGLGSTCATELTSGVKAGYLNGDSIWPKNQGFEKALTKALTKWGYITS